jgi:hypothetical protein
MKSILSRWLLYRGSQALYAMKSTESKLKGLMNDELMIHLTHFQVPIQNLFHFSLQLQAPHILYSRLNAFVNAISSSSSSPCNLDLHQSSSHFFWQDLVQVHERRNTNTVDTRAWSISGAVRCCRPGKRKY